MWHNLRRMLPESDKDYPEQHRKDPIYMAPKGLVEATHSVKAEVPIPVPNGGDHGKRTVRITKEY